MDNGTDGISNVNALLIVDAAVPLATERITQVFIVQFLQVFYCSYYSNIIIIIIEYSSNQYFASFW